MLHHPPIGKPAVEEFYSPLALTVFLVVCGPHVFHVTSHEKARPNIEAFFKEVEARSLTGSLHTFDGCYVPRLKRLSNELSMHARGAAFDVNAAQNPQGGAVTMDPRLVRVGRDLGFFWGGDFKGRFVDGMHFQLGTDFPLDGRPAPSVAPAMLAKYGSAPGQAEPARHLLPVVVQDRDGNVTDTLADAGEVRDGHLWLRAASLAKCFAIQPTVAADRAVIRATE